MVSIFEENNRLINFVKFLIGFEEFKIENRLFLNEAKLSFIRFFESILVVFNQSNPIIRKFSEHFFLQSTSLSIRDIFRTSTKH